MSEWARFRDGVGVGPEIFRVLAKSAPSGVMDVFASDQYNSFRKLAAPFLRRIGEQREATAEDLLAIWNGFASALAGLSTACLFNHQAFTQAGFRERLGGRSLLIGRLEDKTFEEIDGGQGQLARLSIQPEDAAGHVDALKIHVRVNIGNRESWEHNIRWAQDIFERCRKIGKPLFTETLVFQLPGETMQRFAGRLRECLPEVVGAFSRYGHFYKTQVPPLWDVENGRYVLLNRPEELRRCAEQMEKRSDRPMLLLSAAVDFAQYIAQYAIVSDLFSGPMCGRTYFKEIFTDPASESWDALFATFRRVSIPRVQLIQALARALGVPWWSKLAWMAPEARTFLEERQKEAAGRASSIVAGIETRR